MRRVVRVAKMSDFYQVYLIETAYLQTELNAHLGTRADSHPSSGGWRVDWTVHTILHAQSFLLDRTP